MVEQSGGCGEQATRSERPAWCGEGSGAQGASLRAEWRTDWEGRATGSREAPPGEKGGAGTHGGWGSWAVEAEQGR